jgi:D-methionine transport system ATP-binding protein
LSPQIRVEQVSFAPRRFPDQSSRSTGPALSHLPYLLNQISFQVWRGDRVAIVGPSGAGKTLLLRLLNRLSEPIAGKIWLDQQAYIQIPPIQLRQQVLLVLQESKLLGMTVQKALEYPLLLRRLPKQAIQQRIGAWLERLPIPAEWLERTELQLSVGQRQLVAIARALIAQPQVLLLDEPTSALDIGRAQQVLTALKELTDRGEITVLMTNHQLDLAEQFATRVLHLENGMLVQDAVTEQIDWPALRQRIVAAETQQMQEWE